MIELYYFDTCPFCVRVLTFLKDNNVEFVPKNIQSDPKNREELMQLGGKSQVPFLNDPSKNTSMYESNDIIEYVSENYLK